MEKIFFEDVEAVGISDAINKSMQSVIDCPGTEIIEITCKKEEKKMKKILLTLFFTITTCSIITAIAFVLINLMVWFCCGKTLF
jgi:hypothetical protein